MSVIGWFPSPIVKELMGHSIFTEEYEINTKSYIEKAIKSLLKRLRQSKHSDSLDNLRYSISP